METEHLRTILGLKLRRLRQDRGLGLKDLARLSGMSISYLSEIEKGRKYPKPDKMLALARGLDVTFDDLVSLQVDQELNAVKDMMRSPLMQGFPFHLFGLRAQDVVSLVTDVPEKAGALVRTFLEVGRTYDVRVEQFLFAALRSYQQMHDNHFEDLERAAAGFVERHGWSDATTLEPEWLQGVLEDEYGYRVATLDPERYPSLAGLRSIFIDGDRPAVLLNPRLLPSQQAFQLGREIGYNLLGLDERSSTSSPLEVTTFDQVINDFKAAYFSGALLIDERDLVGRLANFLASKTFDLPTLIAILDAYRATPELFLYRVSQIVPVHFGLTELFFMRFSHHPRGDDELHIQLTKNLNMSRVPVPYGIGLSEHYCRRWPGLRLLADPRKQDRMRFRIQRSHFIDDDSEFFVFSVARPLAIAAGAHTSISMGFLVDDVFKRRVRFWNDPAVPRHEVNLTCERCRLPDCAERASPPLLIEEEAERTTRAAELAALEDEFR
ncbi:MAG: helix-turn-helix domain-containing protein, partial [Acidobacteriota bacterium]